MNQFSMIFALLLLHSLCSPPSSSVCASNILFFHVGATTSHRTAIWPLAEALADAGHNVTYIFPMSKRMGSHPQIMELTPSNMAASVDSFIGAFDINIRLNNTLEEWMMQGFFNSLEWCGLFYDSPEVHQWLATPGIHYDLLLLDGAMGHCAFGLVHKFRAKHILFSPVSLAYMWDGFGLVPESASVPDNFFHRKPGSVTAGLWGRTINTFASLISRLCLLYFMSSYESVAREKLGLGEEMPSFLEIERETSLVFHNTYFIEDYPLALPPLFVSYSGLHCSKRERQKRKALPNELASFLGNNGTSDGFVYISFGSATDMTTMPEKIRNDFFNALEAFPELKFLWRWEGSAPEKMPKNLLLQKWFPQLDVLAHSNIKAFITQAGRPSTGEALCYGVPMIAIPFFADQDFNADRLGQIGAAIRLDIESITTEKLVAALNALVKGDLYKKRAKELSAMFQDRPVDPLENAVYWVDYVLKYNTSLLKPLGMHQTWWQRRLLDVYAFIAVVLLVFVGICLVFCALLFKCSKIIIANYTRRKVENEKKIK